MNSTTLPGPFTGVQRLGLNSWEQIARGFESDEINAAFINIPLAMGLFEQGLDIVLLMFTHRRGSLMICPSGINQIPDFKGRSILIPHRLSVQHMLLHKFLDARGIELRNTWSAKAVCAEPIPSVLMPEMTARDKTADIAGFVCEAPFATAELEQGNLRQVLATGDLWPDHPCSAFLVRRELLENQGKRIKNLVRSLFRSAATLDTIDQEEKNTKDDLMAQASSFLKQPRQTIAAAIEHSGISYAPERLVPDLTPLDIIQKYMGQTMGLISGNIDLKAFTRPEFARDALKEADS